MIVCFNDLIEIILYFHDVTVIHMAFPCPASKFLLMVLLEAQIFMAYTKHEPQIYERRPQLAGRAVEGNPAVPSPHIREKILVA